MITSIKIKKLFGYKDTIDITFNDNLTILIGPNGSGKTTILNIINNIMNSTYLNLLKYKFEYIEISYNRCNSAIIRKRNKIYIITNNSNDYNIEELVEKEDEYLLSIEGINVISKEVEDGEDEEFEESISMKDDKIPYSTLYFPTYRRSEVELTQFLRDELYNRRYYSMHNSNYYKFKNTVVGINNRDIEGIVRHKWIEVSNKEARILNSFISEMFLSFLKVNYNSNDLLDEIEPEEIEKKIIEILTRTKLKNNSDNMDSKIKAYTNNIENAKNIKTNIDAIFDVKDIKGKELIDIKEKELDNLLKKLEQRRFVSYSLTNILDIIDLYHDKCKNIENIKLPFKNLEDTLNEFLYPKITEVNNGKLIFKENETSLTFEDLSAGEKQLITIFSYICLGVKKNGVVIIDEPEISLHINWQKIIIKKLIENRPDIQFIISTHSPNILLNHRDSKVKLGEYIYE